MNVSISRRSSENSKKDSGREDPSIEFMLCKVDHLGEHVHERALQDRLEKCDVQADRITVVTESYNLAYTTYEEVLGECQSSLNSDPDCTGGGTAVP